MRHTSLAKKVSVAAFAATSALFLPLAALAETAGQRLGAGVNEVGAGTGLSTAKLETVAGRIIFQFMGLLGILLVGLIMYAGYLWTTAQGDDEQVTKAKTIIKNAVIGLILLMLSYSIANLVIAYIINGTA